MAELRSFLIGVVVAGVLLALVAFALGAFSDDNPDPTSARLISSPVATATAGVTPGPDTTALPTLAATTQPSPTPTEGPGAEPTEAPTNTPEPEPTADPVNAYLAVIQPILGDLDANIGYVIGQGSANPDGSTQAANTIKALAGRLGGASPPDCMTSAHGTVVQGGNEASAAADQLIAALAAGNNALVQAALDSMNGARGTLGSGAAAVSSAPC